MNRTRLLLAGLALSALTTTAVAQVAPPFFGGGGIFDPEIDVINSGIILDAQATVSADRKYVTMTTRTSSTELVALREFAFQVGGGGGGGFVGGTGQGNAGGGGAANPIAAGAPLGAADSEDPGERLYKRPKPLKDPSILEREGMTLVGRVGN